MQSIHRLTRVVAQGVAQRQNAEQYLAAHHQHYRLPGAFQLLDLRLMLCRGGFAGGADQMRLPLTSASIPEPASARWPLASGMLS